MSFSQNKENGAYRKWVNVVTTLMLPGSAHVMTGRGGAGVLWFIANLGVSYVSVILLFIVPAKLWLVVGLIFLIRLGFRTFAAADSCRKPIFRLSFIKWICFVAAALFTPLVILLTNCLIGFRPLYTPTSGMEPTLKGERRTRDGGALERGDHIVITRFVYLFHPPRRGDVAVFRTDAINSAKRESFGIPEGELYVKRIVGLPGERVSVQAHSITINGEKLLEPRIFERIMAQTNVAPNAPPGVTLPSIDVQLGADEYFVLGDNISNSLDSRYYGGIKSGHFEGKVLWIFWPAERQRRVE